MKKVIIIALVALSTQVSVAQAGESTYNVLLAGGPEVNSIHIWLMPDGRTYVIDSIGPLEVGGSVCENPPENHNELICQAPLVNSFEVNADGGNDQIRVSQTVNVPVTLRGGPGSDLLVGGSGNDKLIGGEGADRLIGHDGNDILTGGGGSDDLYGGPGDDILIGGPGSDILSGGSGHNTLRPDGGG
jgi:hypothetical protein